MRKGYSLLEVTLVLTLLGVLISAVGPPFSAWLDRWSVLLARDRLVSVLGHARAIAQVRGGSELFVDVGEGLATVDVPGARVWEIGLTGDGVALSLLSGRDSTRIRFDALGIGRIASQTFLLRRGAAEARVVVSALGRVRVR
jgi:prepilin-type N-terminal cleavage/methylation domain-containing protein